MVRVHGGPNDEIYMSQKKNLFIRFSILPVFPSLRFCPCKSVVQVRKKLIQVEPCFWAWSVPERFWHVVLYMQL